MRVLYICTGNSFRSPTAEALTRRYRPELEVESAGINPASKIAGNAQGMLKNEGAQRYVKPRPESVTERAISEADKIVVMGKEHKEYLLENFNISPAKIENWNVNDPINPGVDPEDAFAEIKRKVKEL